MSNPNTKIVVFEHSKDTGDGFRPASYVQLWQLRGCPMWSGKVGQSSHEILYRLDDELGFQYYLIEARDPPRLPEEHELWHTPPEDPSGYDSNYKAVILSPAEACSWLTRNGYDLPDDLKKCAESDDTAKRSQDKDKLDKAPLPDAQQEIWDLLKNKAMSAKEIAEALQVGVSQEAIIKRISAIRKSGRKILNQRGLGYWRPDAPPPEDTGAAAYSE